MPLPARRHVFPGPCRCNSCTVLHAMATAPVVNGHMVLSPFVQRAIAGQLPAKVLA